MDDAEVDEAELAALLKAGHHRQAADRLRAAGQLARASELLADIWSWPEAIALAEQAERLDLAYRYALAADERSRAAAILTALETRPEQALVAAEHAVGRGRLLDAARLHESVGRAEDAAALYERAGELADAARCRLTVGQTRKAGILFERRLRDTPDDADAALALGRILAQMGRWEPAVRALQVAAQDEEHARPALGLLVASFAALGLDDAAASRLRALRALDDGLPSTVEAFLTAVYGDPRGAAGAVEGGDQLLGGRYRIERPLGAGATGRVLLAHDVFYERQVAVKVLHVGGGAAGRDAFVRFGREARVAAGIEHPNVVRVFEFNPAGPFLVMEFMSGGTLADRLVSADDMPRPLPAPQVKIVAGAVLGALEAVHRRGVVHRDLKPENVFYGPAGEVKLGDFGVAHLTDLGATLTGALVGTLAYMAPEQITGSQKPEAATDLYALGVILFRALTGQLPFPGPDFVTQHLEAQPPVASDIAPWLGTAFDDVLRSLLAKDVPRRPASAEEVRGLLARLPWTDVERPPSLAPDAPITAGAVDEEDDDEPLSERYRVVGTLPNGELVADELLERHAERIRCDRDYGAQLLAFARADGPHLQAVYEVGDGEALLEHPQGEPWSARPPTGGHRARALAEVEGALGRLHEAGLSHGAVSADSIVLGPHRAVLRLPGPGGSPGSLDDDRSALARLP